MDEPLDLQHLSGSQVLHVYLEDDLDARVALENVGTMTVLPLNILDSRRKH